jgi:hypothetical protein
VDRCPVESGVADFEDFGWVELNASQLRVEVFGGPRFGRRSLLTKRYTRQYDDQIRKTCNFERDVSHLRPRA